MAASFSLPRNLFHWWRQEAEMFETEATSEQINKNNITEKKKLSVWIIFLNSFWITWELKWEICELAFPHSALCSIFAHFLSLSLTFSHSPSAFCLEALNCFRGWRTLCSCVACQPITPCLCLKCAHFRGYAESIQSSGLFCPHSQNKKHLWILLFINQHPNNFHSLKTTPMASINITSLA